MRQKYLNTKVKKGFVDEATTVVRSFDGVVRNVSWSRDDGCYLFSIEYEDGDVRYTVYMAELQRAYEKKFGVQKASAGSENNNFDMFTLAGRAIEVELVKFWPDGQN